MKTHSRDIPRLFFDIETTAMKGVEDWIPEPKVDKRLKDQETAKADKIAEMIEKAPLDPDLATVRLISMQIGTGGVPTIILVPSKKMSKARTQELAGKLYPYPTTPAIKVLSETNAITAFWGALAMCNGCSVGYNTLAFDLPFLMRRSMDLRIQPGITPSMAKYRTEPTTDLYGALFNWSWEGGKKFKWVMDRYGIEVLAPEQDGSMVADMTDEELITYGLSDLHGTVELYQRMNGIYFNHLGGE